MLNNNNNNINNNNWKKKRKIHQKILKIYYRHICVHIYRQNIYIKQVGNNNLTRTHLTHGRTTILCMAYRNLKIQGDVYVFSYNIQFIKSGL